MSDTTFLYRFFDRSDRLLYVGITQRIESRLSTHKHEKPWEQVSRIEIQTLDTRAAALEAERFAIETEDPLWNKQYAHSRLEVLVFLCDLCKKPIDDDEGYVHADWRTALSQEQAERRNGKEHEGFVDVRAIDLAAHEPFRIPWERHHIDCDPDPNDDHYWIEVGRLRTWPLFVSTLAHLSEKRWVRHTNFSGFMRGVVFSQPDEA